MARRPPSRGVAPVAVALLLLALAAWVGSLSERGGRATARAAVDFPSRPRPRELERIAARQTLPPPPAPAQPDEPEPPTLRDPFLRALPGGVDDPFVVLEANALRHSRLGELFVQCVLSEDPDAFGEVARKTGIDPLKDLDRLAFTGSAVIASGFFDRVPWEALQADRRARPTRYGDEATLWIAPRGDDAIAAWRDQLIVVGPIADVRRAIDQVEGRAEPARPDLADDVAFGELYGVVPGAAARRLLPASEGALAARVAAAARRIELHVDAMDAVAGVLRVTGGPGRETEDLAKSLGAALSVARLEATATDDWKLAALLENAEVLPGDGGFTVQLALPAELLQDFFADCGRSRASPPAR